MWPEKLDILSKDGSTLITIALYREAWSHFKDDRYDKCLKEATMWARNKAWTYVRERQGQAVFDAQEEAAYVHDLKNFIEVQPTLDLPVSYRTSQTAAAQRVQEVFTEEMPLVAERILMQEGFQIQPEYRVNSKVQKYQETKIKRDRRVIMTWDQSSDDKVYSLVSARRFIDGSYYCRMAATIAERFELADKDTAYHLRMGWKDSDDSD